VVRSPLLFLLIPSAVILAVPALTPTDQLFPNQGDVGLYLDDARAVVGGRVPYSDVQLEYPPLALVPMVVPYLVGRVFGEVTIDAYKWLFAGWEAVLVFALGLVLARIARIGGIKTRRRDPAWVVVARVPVLVVGAALAIAWRFDLFAALLLAIGLWAALADRATVAGIAVGLGILAKLYPIAAAPALAIAWLLQGDASRVVRFGLAGALTVMLSVLPFVAIAGVDALSFLGYQAGRGLQIESIGGGLVLLEGSIRGLTVETSAPFKALEVMGSLARAWVAVLPVLTVVGFGVLAWVGWRRARAEVEVDGTVAPATTVTLAAASVMLLLVTSKVFSIQYVVWLVPFAALLPGWKFWLAAGIVALTMPIHPFLYDRLVAQDALPILVLNLRNALLVILTVWVIDGLRQTPSRTVEPAAG
jgi:hypothetical protein